MQPAQKGEEPTVAAGADAAPTPNLLSTPNLRYLAHFLHEDERTVPEVDPAAAAKRQRRGGGARRRPRTGKTISDGVYGPIQLPAAAVKKAPAGFAK